MTTQLIHPRTGIRAILLIALLATFSIGIVRAQIAKQTIPLAAGWNAVWLEVEPTYPTNHPRAGQPMAPEDVFSDPKIDIVASPKQLAGLSELFFLNDASLPDFLTISQTFNQEGWEQWHRGAQVGNNLVMMTGNRAYLIHTTDAVTPAPEVEGKVKFFRPKWTPDRYNLVGFGTDESKSFEQFFAAAGGIHPVSRIFTLSTDPDGKGNWLPVTSTTAVGNQKAYWIFCDGPSDFMGPVAVDFDGAQRGAMDFGGPEDAVEVDGSTASFDLEELVLTNLTASAVAPSLVRQARVAPDPVFATQDELQLKKITPVPGSFQFELGNDADLSVAAAASAPLTSVAAGKSGTTIIGADARRQWSVDAPPGATRTQLFRLKTGGGNEFWLPVRALDTTLPNPPAATAPQASGAGLWVGAVIYDSATSIVEDGSPRKPAASKAPMRLIVHSNGTNTVKLLNQVTIMQTRSADPAVPPVPKLVVDPRKIPFFEGIKRRNGKLVGLRVQTVGYDMSRDVSQATQMALVDRASEMEPSVDLSTEEKLRDYLTERTTRPPELVEKYILSLELDGDLRAGQKLETKNDSPLRLDPFHRSNPFRHAFHQMHGAGPSIKREFSLVFDTEQPVADRLAGTFTETITGLIKQELELSGRVELQRVSTVSSLEE